MLRAGSHAILLQCGSRGGTLRAAGITRHRREPGHSSRDCRMPGRLSARSQARIEEFAALVTAHQAEDAMSVLGDELTSTEDDRRFWRLQLTAIRSMRIRSLSPTAVGDWTEERQIFKLVLDVDVTEHAADAAIPYYGWEDTPSIRWVTMELSSRGQWQITSISTGP